MNEKLKKWNMRISDRLPKGTRNKGNGCSQDLVVLTVYQENSNRKHARDILRVSMHEKIEQLTGWKVGDVIDAEIKDGTMVMHRSDVGARICRSHKNSKRTYIRYSMPLASLIGFPVGACREIESGPGRLAFLLPELN